MKRNWGGGRAACHSLCGNIELTGLSKDKYFGDTTSGVAGGRHTRAQHTHKTTTRPMLLPSVCTSTSPLPVCWRGSFAAAAPASLSPLLAAYSPLRLLLRLCLAVVVVVVGGVVMQILDPLVRILGSAL